MNLLNLVADFLLVEGGAIILKAGSAIWNAAVGIIFDLLGQSVNQFAGGSGWNLLDQVEPVFLALGTTLMVLFFLHRLFESSYEDSQIQRQDIVLKSLLPLCAGQALMSYSRQILNGILQTASGLVGSLGSVTLSGVRANDTMVSAVRTMTDCTLAEQLIIFILCLIVALVMVLCAGVLVYIVYFRFIKILIAMPFAPVAISSLAGTPEVRRSGIQYFKYFVMLALEAVVIMLAIMLCNALLAGGIPDLETTVLNAISTENESTQAFTSLLLLMFFDVFACCLTVGSAKGAEMLLQKMFG